MSANFGEQLTFSGLEPSTKRKSSRNSTAGAAKIAENLPVASVIVEKLPIHLDREFDYLVPEKFDQFAVPGASVKVPFGGQVLGGYIVSRRATSEHQGRLSPLKSVVSKVPLFDDDSLVFFRKVAQYYGGAVADVLRLAVPARHATAEKLFVDRYVKGVTRDDSDDHLVDAIGERADEVSNAWTGYVAGASFVDRVVQSCVDPEITAPRAVWTALPGFGVPTSSEGNSAEIPHWAVALAQLAKTVSESGRRSLIVVPNVKDVNRLRQALEQQGFALGASNQDSLGYVTLTHEISPAQRYGHYLLAANGKTDVVIGTRSASFVPVPDIGLAVCWEDGDDSHQDRHAPYPHTREVLALRSELSECALIIGSLGRTLHAQSLLASGWAGEIAAPREVLRSVAPHVIEFGEYEIAADSGGKFGRLPERVWREIRACLDRGPVLIQVPRGGYVPAIACGRCREAARCSECHGPLGLPKTNAHPQCTWCGALNGSWSCVSCGFTRMRAIHIGSERTAEELGRAFPGVPIVSSAARARDGVVEAIKSKPSLVIATPGAEPYVPSGYVLGVILDAHVGSSSAGLYAHQELLSRWQGAAALVRARTQSGKVYLVGRGAALPTAALVRWDAPGMAARELEERTELHLPPSWRVAAVSGDRLSVSQFLSALQLPSQAEVLGPVVTEDANPDTFADLPNVRAIVRVPMREGRELAKSLNAMARIASARRQTHRVDVVLDPKELL